MGKVFVLGAGFTKAFVTEAPARVDDFGTEELKEALRPHQREKVKERRGVCR